MIAQHSDSASQHRNVAMLWHYVTVAFYTSIENCETAREHYARRLKLRIKVQCIAFVDNQH